MRKTPALFGHLNAESDSSDTFSNGHDSKECSGIQTLDMMSCINRFLYELQNGGAKMSDSYTNSKAGWPRYFIHDQYKADARGRNTNLIGGTFMTISEVKNFFHFSYSS